MLLRYACLMSEGENSKTTHWKYCGTYHESLRDSVNDSNDCIFLPNQILQIEQSCSCHNTQQHCVEDKVLTLIWCVENSRWKKAWPIFFPRWMSVIRTKYLYHHISASSQLYYLQVLRGTTLWQHCSLSLQPDPKLFLPTLTQLF